MGVHPAVESTADTFIIGHVEANIGWITLNRDKALNSLTHEMVQAIYKLLHQWEKEPSVQAIVVQGHGRAFCAGGDVRNFYYNKLDGKEDVAIDFFKEEYRLNSYIKVYPKPYISVINGINMGGGMGISIHGSHRVVTENAKLSMPETTIGFFTDVGGTYFLSRIPKSLGIYLGLTGEHIKPEDSLYTGLATHYVPSENLALLIAELKKTDLSQNKENCINQVLEKFIASAPESSLARYTDTINHCFSKPTVEEILKSLEEESSEFSFRTLQALNSKSPTSLKVVLRALQLCKEMAFLNCMTQELHLAQEFVKQHDFAEGVRALLVDKDKNPQWNPSRLEDVSEAMVSRYFEN